MRIYVFRVLIFSIGFYFSLFTNLLANDYSAQNGFFHSVEKYIYIVRSEQVNYWPNHPMPELLAGLIEQETCITLKSKNCWSPSVSVKNHFEEGAGLGQLTRGFRSDGSIRFDTLKYMRENYYDLKDLSWHNIYHRPDLQIRAIVLLSKRNFDKIKKPYISDYDALAFADAAYNGGLSGLMSDRSLCKMQSNCNQFKWFDNVEHTCSKSKKHIFGKRSFCDINREHVRNVMLLRSQKYRKYF